MKSFRAEDYSNIVLEESRDPNHMIELAKGAGARGFKSVIAVGGDGTVHGIASALIDSDMSLGIIPTGSGNGIARHLGLSMNPQIALKQTLTGRIKTIDTLKINETKAIGFGGIGFDAFVAKLFDQSKTRGFWSYVKLTLNALRSYKDCNFTLDDLSVGKFMVIAANISQYGNNAFINPESIDDDGKFEYIAMDRPRWYAMPFIVLRLFNRTLHNSKYTRVERWSKMKIINIDRADLQIDGEPAGNPEEINISINPQSLNVIIP